jgi:hypothetical protein
MENLIAKRNKLEEQINTSIEDYRGELSRINEQVAQQLNTKPTSDVIKEEEEVISTEPPITPSPPKETRQSKPLIYFSYPMSGYAEQPAWVNPLRQVLVQNGYLTYNPWDNIDAQYGKEDLPALNALPLKVVKSLCSILQIPEETLLPFEAVWKLLVQGDNGDNFSIVFQCLWFLTRSSLVICDLMRPMAGAGVAQELLYSKQLGIPVIGLFPTSGQLNPFAHRSTTALFSGNDLLSMLPMVKGYAPL